MPFAIRDAFWLSVEINPTV